METNNQPKFSDKNKLGTSTVLFQNNNSNIIIIILVILLVLSLLGVNFFLMVGEGLDSVFMGIKYYFLKFLSLIGFYSGAVINTSADVAGDAARGTVDIAEGTIQSIGNLLQNRDNMDGPSLEQKQLNMNFFGMNPTPTSFNSNEEIAKLQMENEQLKQNQLNQENSFDNVNPYISSSVEKINKMNEKIIDFADTINSKGNELQTLDKEINERKQLLKSMPTEGPSDSTINWCPVGYEENKGQCITIGKDEKCMYGKVFPSKEECENDVKKPSFSGYSYQGNSVNWGIPPPPPPPAALSQKPIIPCPQLPGMCLNQKPMCGSCPKQMPMSMQPVPYRGAGGANISANMQQPTNMQQPQQQPNKLPPLPTFPNSQESTEEQQTTPDQSPVNQNDYENPIPGALPNNLGSIAPIDYSGMIMNNSSVPSMAPTVEPTAMPSVEMPLTPSVEMPLTPSFEMSVTPSVEMTTTPSVEMTTSKNMNDNMNNNSNLWAGHHHHPHSHNIDGGVSPFSEKNDLLNKIDLSSLESDITNLNSVVSNLKIIKDSDDDVNSQQQQQSVDNM